MNSVLCRSCKYFIDSGLTTSVEINGICTKFNKNYAADIARLSEKLCGKYAIYYKSNISPSDCGDGLPISK
jgi:hypothetical protein